MNEDRNFFLVLILVAFLILIGVMVLVGVPMYVFPKYSVWQKSLAGQAQLAQAEWNRQIAVKEAEAKMNSAKLLAQAEVTRAYGVAKANKIIGQSLNNNEAYLRYLWIQNISDTRNQIIYVPTEANLPITEASRLTKYPAKKTDK